MRAQVGLARPVPHAQGEGVVGTSQERKSVKGRKLGAAVEGPRVTSKRISQLRAADREATVFQGPLGKMRPAQVGDGNADAALG